MKKRSPGHSLLEMIIAIFVFLSIVVGLMGIWSTYAVAIGKARSILVATYLGERVMETCIAAKFANIDLLATNFPQQLNTRALIRGNLLETKYDIEVAVDPNGPAPSPELKDVVVTVTWYEKMADHSENRTLEFHTMLSSKG